MRQAACGHTIGTTPATNYVCRYPFCWMTAEKSSGKVKFVSQDSFDAETINQTPWYKEVTGYQWLVVLIASLGWVFDVFEGQIFVASMNEAMPDLLPQSASAGYIGFANNVTLGAFLLGGALGGVAFGVLSDRIGRKKVMTYTILMYSLFTCVTAFSTQWWHMAGFRFLVAMGVGGEWAVASAMVAEVVPSRARARLLGIFHASSVFGTLLAVAAGEWIIRNPPQWLTDLAAEHDVALWRVCFMVGVLPALLIIWIRASLREPENWQRARESAAADLSKKLGDYTDLFRGPLLRNTVVGVGLAAVGLATFWGAHIYGKDILRRDVELENLAKVQPQQLTDAIAKVQSDFSLPNASQSEVAVTAKQFESAAMQSSILNVFGTAPKEESEQHRKVHVEIKKALLANYFQSNKGWELLGLLATTLGGGLGLLCFGPICERIGRRGTFLLYHLGGLVSAIALFQFVHGAYTVLAFLPVFGFLTLGMHAGYAIYFPELFPTRLRGTGGGFCFNVGRILAAPILFVGGWLQLLGLKLEDAASLLSLLFLLGVVLILFARETKGQELPE